MTPKERLAQLKKEAADLRAQSNEFTKADVARANTIVREVNELEETIANMDAATTALKAAGMGVSSQTSAVEAPGSGGLLGPSGRRTGKAAKAPAADTTQFTENVLQALQAASPTIGGPFVQKALIPNGAVTAGFSGVIVNDPRNSFSLYAAVQHADAEGQNAGTYLRQTARTNNAASVKDGDLKPLSTYGLEQQKWRLSTVAHVSEPMQRQWFEDYTGLEQFIATEMAYGVDQAVAQMILNGGVDEDGGIVTGILNTTGIGQTAYSTSALRTIRTAITQLQVTGAVPQNVVLNPTDWEAIESELTTDGKYLFEGAPQHAVTPTLFGLPVLLSTALPAGQAVVGDLSSVVVIDRGDLMLAWSEGGHLNTGTAAAPNNVELFRANKLVWRAEMRLGLQVMSTKLLRVADLATG